MALGKKTGGREKGVPNKLTRDVKAAIREAFAKAGGVKYLTDIAKTNPAVFCQLLGKVIPREITGEDGAPIPVEVSGDVVILTAEERAERVQGILAAAAKRRAAKTG